MNEVRARVCAHCIERPPGGPPCAPLGKRCGVELHLPALVELVLNVHSAKLDPYVDSFHENICTTCPNKPTSQCPCPLDTLMSLAVQAIETVDMRRAEPAEAAALPQRSTAEACAERAAR